MKNTVKHSFKVGDILYSSWGYDQTNIDLYQITELNGASMVTLKPVYLEIKEDQRDGARALSRSVSFKLPSEGGAVRYISDPIHGEKIRRKVSHYNGDDFIKISDYEHARLYTGFKLSESWYA